MDRRDAAVSAAENPITDMRAAEHEILALANGLGKFAVGMGPLPDRLQLALERLQLDDRIRLIDVTPLPHIAPGVFRCFKVVRP